MRNFITLLTTAILVVACADDSPTTSPPSRSTAGTTELRATNQSVTASAKPVDQVGFTKVSYVTSGPGYTTMPGGAVADFTVSCPAGSTVVTGGYTVPWWDASAVPPFVLINGPNGNGWKVRFSNEAPGMKSFQFYMFATCLS